MKDCTQQAAESSRPTITLEDGLEFCLTRLFKDQAHSMTDEVVDGLTFEELIGVLLLARDKVNEGDYDE